MKPGLVSNCWKTLLEQGSPIRDLVKQGRDQGYLVIELRQGCLGDAETAALLARPEQLSILAQECQGVIFDYAMTFPFLCPDADYRNESLGRGLEAALATGGQSGPHLRIVDVTTAGTAETVKPNLESLVSFSASCLEQGVQLSLEHSRQPWKLFYDTVCQLRRELGHADFPAICFDPANFSLVGEQELSLGLLESLRLKEISMVHLKQFQKGLFLETLDSGAVDWGQHRAVLEDRGYDGPLYLEIMPSESIWQRLKESLEFWERCSPSI